MRHHTLGKPLLSIAAGLALMLSAVTLQAKELAPDTFFRGGLEQLNSLDPLHGMDELHASVFSDLFEGLLEMTPEGSIGPAVAEDWAISADGKTYTFALRQASWSNGTPILASHFVTAIERALSPSSKASQLSMLFPIKNAQAFHEGSLEVGQPLGVKAIDEQTLRIELHTATPHFLSVLTYRYLTPIISEEYDYSDVSTENLRRLPFNGPFVPVSHEEQQSILLRKNPIYWDHLQVSIPKVKYILGTYDGLWEAYRAGELDYVQIIPAKAFDWAKENIPSEILIAPQFATYFYELDIRFLPLENRNIRQALNLVVDREALATSAIQQGHLPTDSLTPPHLPDYKPARPSWAETSIEERLHIAQSMMADAGFSTQTPLELSLAYNTSDDHRRIAEAVASQWQNHLPVVVELKHFRWNDYRSGRSEQNAGMINRYGWSGDYLDPLAFLSIARPDNPMNYMGYKNPAFEQLLQAASQTTQREKRYELLHQAEQILIDDSVIMPLFHYSRRSAIKERIVDWESNTGFILMSKYLTIQQLN